MNYIGSKFRLIGFIEDVFKQETNGSENRIIDLFAGTSTVGKHFKRLGYEVVANDLQYYSYVLGRHYIENNRQDDLNYQYFEEFNRLGLVEGFIYRNYAQGSGSQRNYFTDVNAKKIDTIRQYIEELYQTNKIDEDNYFFYLASLLESADKRANTASVYGAFLKHIKKTASEELYVTPCEVINSSHYTKMFNGDANELITQIEGDVLYLDPPYNTRQYSTNYHLLETIARYDDPRIHGKTGLRSDDDHLKSDYAKKKEAFTALEGLIRRSNVPLILMSYNSEGIIGIDQIEKLFSEYGTYKQYKKAYPKFKSNVKQKNEELYEYIHVLRKQ